jgi:hypothetical protein
MKVAETDGLVNGKMNGYGVVDKSVCPCLCGNQEAKSASAFAFYILWKKFRSRDLETQYPCNFADIKIRVTKGLYSNLSKWVPTA